MSQQGGPTRTDLLLRAVIAAIEGERTAIDAGTVIGQVAVVVNFDERSGQPRRTIVRPEYVWNLRPGIGQESEGG